MSRPNNEGERVSPERIRVIGVGAGPGGRDDQGHHGAGRVVQGRFGLRGDVNSRFGAVGGVQERHGRYSLRTVTSLRGEPGLTLATVSIV